MHLVIFKSDGKIKRRGDVTNWTSEPKLGSGKSDGLETT